MAKTRFKTRTLENQLLRVLDSITAEGKSSAMISKELGISIFAIRRSIQRLELDWGVKVRFARRTKADDGSWGCYLIEDFGPFSAARVRRTIEQAKCEVEETDPSPSGNADALAEESSNTNSEEVDRSGITSHENHHPIDFKE